MENCDDDNDEASSHFPISSLLTLEEINANDHEMSN